jgi:hypothetical protein
VWLQIYVFNDLTAMSKNWHWMYVCVCMN